MNPSLIDFSSKLSTTKPHQYISQFPNESLLTVKDLFAIVMRTGHDAGELFDDVTMESVPSWHQTTYDLLTELPQFVSFFQNREKR